MSSIVSSKPLSEHVDVEATASHWFVVNTHAHREGQACDHLVRQGFEVYNPVVNKTIRHARRVQNVLRPLFPGYLFVNNAQGVGFWRPIASTTGVRNLLRNGDAPCCLDPRLIEALKNRETDGVITRPHRPIEIGHTVRLASGPFDGFAATIVTMPERDRVVVLLEFLNQSTKVEISTAQISPV
ncbi:MAG: transcription termination/antitermination protein NusG [Hyphomicrobium sp.]